MVSCFVCHTGATSTSFRLPSPPFFSALDAILFVKSNRVEASKKSKQNVGPEDCKQALPHILLHLDNWRENIIPCPCPLQVSLCSYHWNWKRARVPYIVEG